MEAHYLGALVRDGAHPVSVCELAAEPSVDEQERRLKEDSTKPHPIAPAAGSRQRRRPWSRWQSRSEVSLLQRLGGLPVSRRSALLRFQNGGFVHTTSRPLSEPHLPPRPHRQHP